MREPFGCHRITMESSTLWVTGPETAVESNMIIIGTMDVTGTMDTITTGTMGTITTKTGTTLMIMIMIMSASDA
jgi:hypothetical protein